MQIELTPDQAREVALTWIKSQQQAPDGYKKVLDVLLMGAHFAVWSWHDAISYAIKKCARAYHVDRKVILEDLK